MRESIRKHEIRKRLAWAGLITVVMLIALYNTVPAFAALFQGVVVSGTPDFPTNNSPPTVATLTATGTTMDSDGTHATLGGHLIDLSTPPTADVWFEWYQDIGNTHIVGLETLVNKTGYHYYELSGYDPVKPVTFRFVGENTDGRANGEWLTFYCSGGLKESYSIASLAILVVLGLGLVRLVAGAVGMFGGVTGGVVGLLFVVIYINIIIPAVEGLNASFRGMW